MMEILKKRKFFRPALGAALTALCGLLLWKSPLGEPWVNASYDYLFRFGSRAETNKAVLILMDNDAFAHFNQVRIPGRPWDRGLHAQLLQRLADDGAALVVLDSFLREPGDPARDQALADMIRRQRRMVLVAKQAELTHPKFTGSQPVLPADLFLDAAGTNWGVAWLDPDLDSIVRRHWPFPAPGPYPSLPWAAARLAGAPLAEKPREQWLRFYGRDDAWTRISYRYALAQPTNFFRNRIVFIGTQPATSLPDGEDDEFLVPSTRWTGESVGGTEILLTAFLNLVNGDWLTRPPWWVEALLLVGMGISLSGFLCQLHRLTACAGAAAIAVAVSLIAVSCSYYTDYWFPWLVVAGGQVPCALAWALVTWPAPRAAEIPARPTMLPEVLRQPARAMAAAISAHDLPDTPDYELFEPPFGEGAYGKVWLARNAIGQWQALKVVYLKNFGNHVGPYEREFNGIKKYKPVSDKHPGLLRIDFVSRQREGYFYYVMELGDPVDSGWEKEPSTYKPRDLVSERARAQGKRLPVRECVRIGLELTDALDYLHKQGLTHRDIKPQNIIFVNGHAKLADVGLIAEIRPVDEERTFVGTPGYMPPPPERPGSAQADIYSLGMVLYVLSTGRNSAFFPEISTTLLENQDQADFFPLNSIILKACQPDCARRYASAALMQEALLKVQQELQLG